ncbi:hypothetical protein Micbo1qcDRAFT_156789, partial [Microdochium bolleyi]
MCSELACWLVRSPIPRTVNRQTAVPLGGCGMPVVGSDCDPSGRRFAAQVGPSCR